MPRECEVLPEFKPGQLEFPPVSLYQYSRSLKDELADGFPPEEARLALRYMLSIRLFEQTIVELKSGRYKPIPGFRFIGATHLSMGQEGAAVGTMSAIRPDDYITSSHRGHGHAIAKGAYWLEAQDAESLAAFIGERGSSESRDVLFQKALHKHLIMTFAELLISTRATWAPTPSSAAAWPSPQEQPWLRCSSAPTASAFALWATAPPTTGYAMRPSTSLA